MDKIYKKYQVIQSRTDFLKQVLISKSLQAM